MQFTIVRGALVSEMFAYSPEVNYNYCRLFFFYTAEVSMSHGDFGREKSGWITEREQFCGLSPVQTFDNLPEK